MEWPAHPPIVGGRGVSPSHMPMPSVTTVTGSTNDTYTEPLLAHQYPMQVSMGN